MRVSRRAEHVLADDRDVQVAKLLHVGEHRRRGLLVEGGEHDLRVLGALVISEG